MVVVVVVCSRNDSSVKKNGSTLAVWWAPISWDGPYLQLMYVGTMYC